jgi:hypothetical protein
MRARDSMLDTFAAAVAEGRAKMAAGEPVPGLLNNLLTAVDEEGNRCVLVCCSSSTTGNAKRR